MCKYYTVTAWEHADPADNPNYLQELLGLTDDEIAEELERQAEAQLDVMEAFDYD